MDWTIARQVTGIVSLVSVLCCAAPSAAQAPATPVRNASCEELAEDGRPAGWSFSYSSGGRCDFVVDSQVKRAGDGCIRLANHEGGAKFPRMYQTVELAPSTRYHLAAWVRSTTGRANLQVTPGGGTWYGQSAYGAAIGIGASEEWHRIEKRLTTGPGDPAEVNIVFTLVAPNREGVDLWIDDVSLREEGPKPDYSRFIPPADTSVVLPHVAWARDLPGPRRRVLFVAPQITIRDVIELSQRMDVEAEVHYASADLSKVLARPWDAVVFGSVDWEQLDVSVRQTLWEEVRAGTGLFLVKPLGADDELARVLETLRPSATRAFFSGESRMDPPYLHWLQDGAGLRTGTLGQGRVAVIDYDLGNQEDWGARACSLFPPHEGRIPRPDEMPWWEPHFALLARVTAWAAGGLQCEISRVSTVDVGRDKATVDVRTEDAGPGATVHVACVGPGNREVTEATSPVALETGIATVTLQGDFLTGQHFIWVWVQDAQGKRLTWAAHLFRVPGPTVTVIVDRKRYERGDSVRGIVECAGEVTRDPRIEVSLVDSFGRVVDRDVVGANRSRAFRLSSDDVRSLTARVLARLTRRVNGKRRVECESYRTVCVGRELPDDDYLVGIWASYYPLTCSRPWSHHLVRLQRDMGVDFGLMAHSDAESYHQAYAEHGMVPAPESMHRIFFKQSEQYEKMNLAAPDFEAKFRQAIRDRAMAGYKWGALDFSVGDECGYTLRYDEYSIARFREWLADRHGTVARLNEHWGTDLGSWEQVTAELLGETDPSVSIGPLLEFQLFSDRLFVSFFAIALEEVRKLDPRSRCGVSGTRDPGHYIGFDWYRLMQAVTHLAFYDGIQRETIRSFMKPDDVITSFVGYDFYDQDERNARYFPWLELFNGFQGIGIYSASSGDWHGYVRHDLSWTERARWTMEELDELKTGVGRAILTAKRDPAPIAVLYSQRSLHAAGAQRWRGNVTGLCETIKDVGLQFDFVADEQVAEGILTERQYRVLFLPLALALSDEEVIAIESFAHGGGRVIAVGEAGVYNRFGKTRGGGALDDLIGVTTPTPGSTAAQPLERAVARLFGIELNVTPRAATIAEGLGEFEGLETQPCARRVVGRGDAIFLNFLWTGYRSFRSGGVGGEITHRVSADAETAGAYWHLMEELLAGTGIEPPAAVTHDGRSLRYIEQVVYRRGPITYVGILPRYFGGRYAPALLRMRDGQPTDRVLIEPEDFVTAEVSLGVPGHVHDVRARKALGRVQSVQAPVTDGVALLYAVTPYEVTGLQLSAPSSALPGEALKVAVAVRTDAGSAGDHVVHLRLVRPDGGEAVWARENVLTRAGRVLWRLRLALNAPAGAWRVEAQDLISGHTASGEVVVGVK